MRRAERTILFDAPPGFDDPLEMLLGCHRRIEKQLETLKRLRAHVEARGVDAEASSAAESVLKYFQQAAANHHEDEEKDLRQIEGISRVPGIRIYEVGISYYGRSYEDGKKIGWRDGFRAIYCIIKYNLIDKRR